MQDPTPNQAQNSIQIEFPSPFGNEMSYVLVSHLLLIGGMGLRGMTC